MPGQSPGEELHLSTVHLLRPCSCSCAYASCVGLGLQLRTHNKIHIWWWFHFCWRFPCMVIYSSVAGNRCIIWEGRNTPFIVVDDPVALITHSLNWQKCTVQSSTIQIMWMYVPSWMCHPFCCLLKGNLFFFNTKNSIQQFLYFFKSGGCNMLTE